MKRIIKIIIFLLLFLLILSKVSLLLVRKGNGYGTDVLNFYKQKKNSIDILYLGSSHAYSAFNPNVIEEKTGLNGYIFATQQQPIWITYHYLVEALKYQKPTYVILELHMVLTDKDYSAEQVNRDAIDKMKLSINKINAIRTSVEKFDDRVAYYFNVIKYHSRYKELTKNDLKTVFLNYTIDNKGYIGLPHEKYIYTPQKFNTKEEKKISDKNIEYLNKIIELTKKKNIKLIVVKTPAYYPEENYKKLNYVFRLAKENKIDYINYIDSIESLGLDYENDFYDSGHLSKTGSIKLSDKFSEYLNNKQKQIGGKND